jgi:O-antigen/teichoic acid export membrane protein
MTDGKSGNPLPDAELMLKGRRRLILILFGRLAQFLLMLAIMRVATTLLTPGEIGRMSLVMATTVFFAAFLVNPVGMFVNRRLHAWRAGGHAWHYLNRYWGYLILVATMAAVGLTVVSEVGAIGFQMAIGWLLLLVCGSLLFNTANQTVIPSLNLLGYSGWFVSLTVATVAAGFVCATLLAWLLAPTAEFWLLGLLLGQAALATVGALVLFARLNESGFASSPPPLQLRQMSVLYSYAWPISVAVGLSWAQSQGYRYIMEDALGLAPLGLFVAGYGVSMGLIAGVESVLTAYFQPRFYQDIRTDDPVRHAQAWEEYAAAVVPPLLLTMICVATLAPELTRMLLGPAFHSASEYIIWGALAETARVLTGTYSLIAHARMQTRWLLLPHLVGAAFSLALCWWLIPTLGPGGAGVGLAVSGFVVVAAMHVLLGIRIAASIPFRQALVAVALGGGFWAIAVVGRQLAAGMPEWPVTVGMTVLGSTAYVGLQCLLLRRHLNDKDAK